MEIEMQRINAEITSLFMRRQQVLQSGDRARELTVTDAPMHLLNLQLDGLIAERDYWAHEQFLHTGMLTSSTIKRTLRRIDAKLQRVNEQRKQIRDKGPISANETLQNINHSLIALLCADRDIRESLYI